jgi:cytoskeleton protein RodZ
MSAPMEGDRAIDFGARMKRLREERGIALRDIAEKTKISVNALEALERNDMSRLPGGIFSRGFIRAYAEEIGADPEVTVREFITRFPSDSVGDGSLYAASGEGPGESPSRALRGLLFAAAVVLAVAAIGAAVFLIRR